MKKLVIKETISNGGNIMIKIIEQTHFGKSFGKNGEDFYLFKDKFFLSSLSYQCVCNFSHFGCKHGLCVLGSERDNVIEIFVPENKSWLEDMREAVKAYNEYFSNCDICEDRKCNSCPKNKEE